MKKRNVLKPKIEEQMSKNLMFFNVYLADSGRAHAVTSPFRAVKHSIFLNTAVVTYQKLTVLASKRAPPR